MVQESDFPHTPEIRASISKRFKEITKDYESQYPKEEIKLLWTTESNLPKISEDFLKILPQSIIDEINDLLAPLK